MTKSENVLLELQSKYCSCTEITLVVQTNHIKHQSGIYCSLSSSVSSYVNLTLAGSVFANISQLLLAKLILNRILQFNIEVTSI